MICKRYIPQYLISNFHIQLKLCLGVYLIAVTFSLQIVEMGIQGKDVQILDACNRFYTLIPHDFGRDRPTILNTKTLIKVLVH